MYQKRASPLLFLVAFIDFSIRLEVIDFIIHANVHCCSKVKAAQHGENRNHAARRSVKKGKNKECQVLKNAQITLDILYKAFLIAKAVIDIFDIKP